MAESLISFYVILTLIYVSANEDLLQVSTDNGIIRGAYRETSKGRQFVAFTGIPYAKPPIDELRFKPAVPLEPWTGALDASKPHSICPQINVLLNDYVVRGNEDCLYLNVYTPEIALSSKIGLPVLFYIHGGGFMLGSGNSNLYGPDFLLDKDLILVTINYRLGALGFLSTGDDVLPGNNGLKDQNFALKWVKRNIANFGGDPNKITIFGQSAGGASVHFHVLSALSKGLFNAAVAHSGSAVGLWSVAPGDQAIRNAKKLGRLLNCSTDSSKELVDCLRKVDVYNIVEQDKAFMQYSYDPAIPFKPVIEPNLENSFLTQHPINIIKSGEFSNVPLIFGITTDDGAFRTAGLYNNSKLIEKLNKDVYEILPISLQYHETASKNNQKYITSRIRQFYFNNKDIDYTTKYQLTQLHTDSWFFYPQNVAARLHTKSKNVPIYYFVFGYKGSISISPFLGDPTHDYGVCHGDELNYIFSSNFFSQYTPTEADQKIINLLTTMWLNFAETGDPTPRINDIVKTKWIPITDDKKLLYYLIRNADECEMIENIYFNRTKFWDELPLYSKEDKIKTEL